MSFFVVPPLLSRTGRACEHLLLLKPFHMLSVRPYTSICNYSLLWFALYLPSLILFCMPFMSALRPLDVAMGAISADIYATGIRQRERSRDQVRLGARVRESAD